MLYGHLENAYHRVDHLLRLRELQDETGGFQTFIPLAFHPENTKLDHIKKPSALVDLRDDGRQPVDARQLRPHQSLLDHARHRHRANRARPTAPTTSTAPSATN